MKLPEGALLSLSLDSERLDLVDAHDEGISVWMASMEPGVPLSDARLVALRGQGYATEADARREGALWRNAMQAALSRLGFAADFGERSPRGGATELGLKLLSDDAGRTVLNDDPGVITFLAQTDPLFSRFEAKGTKRPDEQKLRDALHIAKQKGPQHGAVETLAFDLYSASFSQESADARMLMLMMALETLLELRPRSDAGQEHVRRMIELTEAADLPADERSSMLGSLSYLSRESISQAGRHLVRRLGDRTYMDLTPVKFFNKCYELRSALAHGHVPRPPWEEVNIVAGNLERMLANLLAGRLLDELPED